MRKIGKKILNSLVILILGCIAWYLGFWVIRIRLGFSLLGIFSPGSTEGQLVRMAFELIYLLPLFVMGFLAGCFVKMKGWQSGGSVGLVYGVITLIHTLLLFLVFGGYPEIGVFGQHLLITIGAVASAALGGYLGRKLVDRRKFNQDVIQENPSDT